METNFHNLIVNGVKLNKLIFGAVLGVAVAFYMLVLPMFYIRFKFWQRFIDAWAIPLPKLIHIFSYLLLAIVVALTPSGKKGELLEFGGCAIFLLTVLFPSNQSLFRD